MTPRSRATGRTPAPRRPASTGAPRPAGPPARLREALRELVEPVVAVAGYDLEQVTVSRAGRRYLVRVIVDGDAGVSLDAIADISRAVSAALDEAEAAGGELMAGEYQLEVSSPGVDRPLTHPRHWRRNRGRLVRVAVAGHQLTARVLDADETGVLLDLGPERHVPYAELGPGRVQIEFKRPGEAAGADDDFGDEFDDEFDDDGFTRDDGVGGPGGKRSRASGVDPRGSGPIEDQELEDEER